jgi:excisionase family DNA binding protein
MENPFEIILEKLSNIERAIEKLNATSNEVEGFMNVEQVASFIGLSKPTIYGLTHGRKIPHFKTGKKLCFKKSEIENWITSSKVSTKQEIKLKASEYVYRNPIV